MHNAGDLNRELVSLLDASPFVEAAQFEAAVIITHFIGGSVSELPIRSSEPVPDDKRAAAISFAERRAGGEPLQYLLGEWEFMSLTFSVGKGVFIPGPDTEHLAQTAIDAASSAGTPLRVLDLCAGSGCVGISVAHFSPLVTVTLVELHDDAFSYLEKNIARSGLSARCNAVKADALTYLGDGKYDIILSNPPYIAYDEYRLLPADVTAQPESALTDGGDGLSFYRTLSRNARRMLNKGGMLAFEIGYRQYEAVSGILAAEGYRHIHHRCDYSGLRRVIIAYI